MLWLLLLVPALLILYIIAQVRRQKYALRFASLSLMRDAIGRGPGIRHHIPPMIFLLALGVIIFSLSRPTAVVTTPSNQGIIILAIDISGSMSADDMKPTRMEALKNAARDFIKTQPPGIQIGIVSFSDSAAIVQSPTDDVNVLNQALDRLAPQRGTSIGRGLLTSIDAINDANNGDEEALIMGGGPGFDPRGQGRFGPTPLPSPTPSPTPTPTPVPKGYHQPAVVVLMSDGENNANPSPIDAAQQMANRGIRVFTVGIGSPQGAVIKIDGQSIRTKLDEATLKQIAQMTDGQYYNATTEKDLRAIYQNIATRLVFRQEKTEITAGLTGIGVLLSLIAGILSLAWLNRLP
jgi:Ca-activated chloride channel family protein